MKKVFLFPLVLMFSITVIHAQSKTAKPAAKLKTATTTGVPTAARFILLIMETFFGIWKG